MVEKYKVITKGSRWNYDLNFDGVKSLEEVRRTLQSIVDDLPHPEIDPDVESYINEEGLNIIFVDDVHLKNQ